MNVLFIGPYRVMSGWGIASKAYLEALLLTGHTVVAKPIYLSQEGPLSVSPEIEEAEKRTFDKPDIIIQHVIPDLFEWHEGYNIGIFFTETYDLSRHPWLDKINLMDEVWVSSPDEKANLSNSGVTCKITEMPIPFNVNNPALQSTNNTLNLDLIDKKYTFYFIGEHTDRKNILAFVSAFQREFDPEENVAIIIKSNNPQLQNDINELKANMRMKRNYVPEILIIGNISEEQIYEIHRRCDCLVVTSYGESLCQPITEALYFNKHVLCNKYIFPFKLFEPHVLPIEAHFEPVFTKTPPMPHLYTSNEFWAKVDIEDLQKQMRLLFENAHLPTSIQKSQSFIIDTMSIQAISERMKKCLSSVI